MHVLRNKTAFRKFSFSVFIFSMSSYACWSLISIGTGTFEGPALDMIEMGDVGVEGVENMGEVEHSL